MNISGLFAWAYQSNLSVIQQCFLSYNKLANRTFYHASSTKQIRHRIGWFLSVPFREPNVLIVFELRQAMSTGSSLFDNAIGQRKNLQLASDRILEGIKLASLNMRVDSTVHSLRVANLFQLLGKIKQAYKTLLPIVGHKRLWFLIVFSCTLSSISCEVRLDRWTCRSTKPWRICSLFRKFWILTPRVNQEA